MRRQGHSVSSLRDRLRAAFLDPGEQGPEVWLQKASTGGSTGVGGEHNQALTGQHPPPDAVGIDDFLEPALPCVTSPITKAARDNRELLVVTSQMVRFLGEVSWFVMRTYARPGDWDHAFEWLERTAEDRESWLVYLKIDPALDSPRSDPRFAPRW